MDAFRSVKRLLVRPDVAITPRLKDKPAHFGTSRGGPSALQRDPTVPGHQGSSSLSRGGPAALLGPVKRAAQVPPIPRHPCVDSLAEKRCPRGVENWQQRVEARAFPEDPPIGEETSE